MFHSKKSRNKAFAYIAFCVLFVLIGSCDNSETLSEDWHHLSSAEGDLPAPGPSKEQTASIVMDVDKNGTDDFIIGSRVTGPSVLWYRKTDFGWQKYVIDDAFLPIEAGGAFADIDGDDDNDIVFGADYQGNQVWWWENPYPDFDPNVTWTRRLIKNSGANQHHDQMFGDFDNDGDQELVFWNQRANKLFLAEIPDEPRIQATWDYVAIFSFSSIKCEGLAKSDIDGDGTVDIVGCGRWFKADENGGYKANLIDNDQAYARAAVGQIKKGGPPEVVFVAGDGRGPLKWYEKAGGSWVAHQLIDRVDHGHSLEVADINGDGATDIFCGEMRLNGKNRDAGIWLFMGDGKGDFSQTTVAKGYGVHEAKLGDLDGDGDLDILGKPYNWETPRIDMWMNIMPNGNQLSLERWDRHVIDLDKPWRSIFITSEDMDGDGLQDIVTGAWWYKNPGKIDGHWKRQAIGTPLNNMAAICDFDGDGDIDVLGTEGKGAEANPSFVWGQNDGDGRFDIFENVSSGNGDFLQGVTIGRFQGHGNVEVALSWHKPAMGIQLISVPSNPSEENWPMTLISSTSQDECLSAGDVDQDGDLDLLLGTVWLRNDGVSWKEFRIAATDNPPDRNRLADLNGDGRLDAIVGFEAISEEGKLAWYEQTDSPTALWDEHPIAEVIGPMSLDVADMDADGDLDIAVGEHNLKNPSEAKLYVFENVDDKGGRWASHVVFSGDEHHDGAQIDDIDGDGDLDIMSIGWGHDRVIVYENKAIAK